MQKAYDKAWLDAIIYALHQNGVKEKNSRMIKNLKSNLTKRYKPGMGYQGKYKSRTEKPGICDTSKHHPRLTPMDGRRMPDPPRPGKTTRNTRCHQPCGQQIPHTIRSSKMQSNKKGKRKEKLPETKRGRTRRSSSI